VASDTEAVAIVLDPFDRLIDLANFRGIPIAQAIEQVDPAFISRLVEPVGVLLDLLLLIHEMTQGHHDLAATPYQLV
jgi:hypothetical protein